MNQNEKIKKQTRIYAIIADHHVYIGKTTTKHLSAVYRNHIHGRSAPTRDTVIAHAQGMPVLHLLEDLCACKSVAYRHIVAWVHIFAQADYTVVNRPGTLRQAADLHPQTQVLVAQLRVEPLEDILKRTRLAYHTAADKYPPSIPEMPEKPANDSRETMQLSVRMTRDEKEAFAQFATDWNMSQRDALLYLMQRYSKIMTLQEELDMLAAQDKAQRTINRLQASNEKLEQQITKLKTTTPESAAPHMTQVVRYAQEGIKGYFASLPATEAPPLPRLGYKRYMRRHPEATRYPYPDTQDYFDFIPTTILYGNAKPMVHFWIGQATDGSVYKIRIYDKYDFVGISPLNEQYSRQEMLWYIRVRPAVDGAADLIFALPILSPQSDTTATTQKTARKPSLAEQIAQIEAKNPKILNI